MAHATLDHQHWLPPPPSLCQELLGQKPQAHLAGGPPDLDTKEHASNPNIHDQEDHSQLQTAVNQIFWQAQQDPFCKIWSIHSLLTRL